MTRKKRTRRRRAAQSERIDSDYSMDSSDPSYWNRSDDRHARKAMQLCRQVAETLDMVLSGECRDELLQSLRVESVQPAPNASRMLVTLCADLAPEEFDRQRILELLDEQSGRLRCEVAASITRKRAPSLVFNVIGAIPPGE